MEKKQRPIKKIRVLEGERPFKFYDPEMAAANLMFTDPRFDQQQMALTLSDYRQQRHHQQLQHQQCHPLNNAHQRPQLNTPLLNISQRPQVNMSQPPHVNISRQQVNIPHAHDYNFTDDYMAMNQYHSGHNHLMANSLPRNSYGYDDLALDTDNSFPGETVNQQQTMSGNMLTAAGIPGTATPVTSVSNRLPSMTTVPNSMTSNGPTNMAPYNGGCLQNYTTPNQNVMRNEPDPLSVLFDQPSLSPFNNNIPPTAASPSNTCHTPNSLSQFPLDGLGQYLMNSSVTSQQNNENFRSSMMANDLNLIKVKKETDNPHGVFAGSLSPSSAHSPSSNTDRDDPDKLTTNLSTSDMSSPSASPRQPMGSGCGASKDPTYMEKRRKNNESAKRSREARRRKEGLLAMRLVQLEEENIQLRAEMCLLDRELEDMRARLFN